MNSLRGEVVLKAPEGDQLQLKFDMNVMRLAEQHAGCAYSELFDKSQIEAQFTLVYCAAKQHAIRNRTEFDLTYDEFCADYADAIMDQMDELTEAMTKAIGLGKPVAGKEEAAP